MSFYLAIVSPLDTPLYELQFTSSSSSLSSKSPSSAGSAFPSWSSFTSSTGADLNAATPAPAANGGSGIGANLGLVGNQGGPSLERHLAQMVAFAALDSVDEVLEGTGNL
jgi:hypothetical protein